MDDRDLLRYSRHILLDEIGIEGQENSCPLPPSLSAAAASARPPCPISPPQA